MKDLWTYLKTVNKPILLYGMGNGADKIIRRLDALGIGISGVFCSDSFVRNKTFHGFKLIDYSTARAIFGDMTVLVAFGTQIPDVMDNIKRISKQCELYVPDISVVDDSVFDIDFAKSNADDIRFVYDSLCDEKSRYTYECIIKNKITGELPPVLSCETSVSEVYENIIKPTSDGIFLDLGAYRGDTVLEYLRYAKNAKKIIAVEPDYKSYSKLALLDIPCMSTLNVAVSDRDGVALFDSQHSRNSRLDIGGTPLSVRSVDSILNGDRCDYIKMDVEGAESDALNGAKNTILNYKPKLCVSAYHRPSDIFALAKQVLEIRSDYKVYLRHFPYIPAWDTNFYFI